MSIISKRKLKAIQDGRKYRMGLILSFVMIAAYALTAQSGVLEDLYSELITGLGMIYLVFCGGNVSNKWVLSKSGPVSARIDLVSDDPPKKEKS